MPPLITATEGPGSLRRVRQVRRVVGRSFAGLLALPLGARLYVLAVAAAGGTAFALHLPLQLHDASLFALLGVIAVVGCGVKLKLPVGVGSANLSVAYTIDFVGLLLLGTGPTMAISATSALVQSTLRATKRNPPHRIIFNIATLLLTVQATGWTRGLLVADVTALDVATVGRSIVPMALVYYLTNTALISSAIALATRQPVWRTWHGSFLWTAPSYFVGAAAAAAAAIALITEQAWVLPIVGMILFLTYRSYTIYIDRMLLERRHNEHVEKLHAQTVEALLQARESEQRYALAAAGSNDGLWDWNILTGDVYCSDRWKLMLGLSPETRIDSIAELWWHHVHAQDLPALRESLQRHFAGETAHFAHEARMLTADGEVRWMLCRGVAVRDSHSRPIRMSGSLTDVTDWRRVQNELAFAASHDALTGLPNRGYFTTLLEDALNRARTTPYRCAVLFIDLDRFKYVNDSLGHVVGDRFLGAVAARLAKQLRPDDVLSRLGGDEFAILVNVLTPADAAAVAERMQVALRAPFSIDGHEIYASASIGIAHSSPQFASADDLLRAADTAMYRAKGTGRGRWQEFDPEMHALALSRLTLETELRRALAAGALQVHYQPIVHLKSGAVTGVEALARWIRPDGTCVEPSDFIPVAEETGMIRPLTQWILEEACSQVATWQQEFGRPLTLAVNASARLFDRGEFVADVERVMQQTNLEADSLRLEITETTLMNDDGGVAAQLEALRRLDVRLHLDDFGTGYSSLSYLQRYPLDALKIDRSFLGGTAAREGGGPIVAAIVRLARELGLGVIAEGVECPEQVRRLTALRCSHAQGFWYSPPVPAPALRQLLEDANDKSWRDWSTEMGRGDSGVRLTA